MSNNRRPFGNISNDRASDPSELRRNAKSPRQSSPAKVIASNRVRIGNQQYAISGGQLIKKVLHSASWIKADHQPVHIKGELLKLSEKGKWQKRYFCLTGSELTYFSNESMQNERVVARAECIANVFMRGKMLALVCEHGTGMRNGRSRYEIQAASIEEAKCWEAAIKNASSAAQKQLRRRMGPTAACIFLHGLGGDGGQCERALAENVSQSPHVKWVFPNAPIATSEKRFSKIGTGRSWFDFKNLPVKESAGINCDELKQALATVERIIDGLVRRDGIPRSRIIVGGFSQGGTLGLLTLLNSEEKLGGCLCFSGWFPWELIEQTANPTLTARLSSMTSSWGVNISWEDKSDAEKQTIAMKSSNADTPIFWGHGSDDDTVLPAGAKKGLNKLLPFVNAGSLKYEVYPSMGHTIGAKQKGDLACWVESCVEEER